MRLTSDSTVKWLQGAASSASVSTSVSTLNYKNLTTGTVTSYTVPSTATITRAGTSVLLSSIAANDFVTIKNGQQRYNSSLCRPSSSQLSGTVTSITYGTTVKLLITDSNGVEYSFLFDIADLPTMCYGDKVIGIDQLKTGNTITVVFATSKAHQ